MTDPVAVTPHPVGGLRDLLGSERGVISIAAILGATVLVIVGKLTANQWLTFVQAIVMALVASKTVTGAIETLKNNPQA